MGLEKFCPSLPLVRVPCMQCRSSSAKTAESQANALVTILDFAFASIVLRRSPCLSINTHMHIARSDQCCALILLAGKHRKKERQCQTQLEWGKNGNTLLMGRDVRAFCSHTIWHTSSNMCLCSFQMHYDQRRNQ